MKTSFIFTLFTGLMVLLASCSYTNNIDTSSAGSAVNSLPGNNQSSSGSGLSREEVVRGLKEALDTAARQSARKASETNGFFKRPTIKVPFPPEAKDVKEKAESLGMDQQVNKFVKRLNRAAENASKKAAPIFLNAIKEMSIKEAFEILNGSDTAATHYLKENTSQKLFKEFLPVVKNALDEVHITRYWDPLATKYNQATMLTGGEKVNPDLDRYVTNRAIDGLFHLVGKEEAEIRKNPKARATELLKKVFGEQDD